MTTMTMNAHDFTVGAPINNPSAIRQNRVPLTIDQIRKAAPSAFATGAHHSRSDRYTYLPTAAVIENMLANGFQAFAAQQSRTRIADKQEFTKHMIRFRMPNAETSLMKVGDVFPEIALINSHDGSSAYKLMAAFFRLACSNGLIVADSRIASISVRHSGNIVEEVAAGSVQIVRDMPQTIDAIERWKQIQLTAPEQKIIAQAAHTVRFADAEGHVNTPIRPDQLLHTRRQADNGNDLWTVFNKVQENVINGGASAVNPTTFRRTTARKVNGIDQDVRLNKALWTMAEQMAALKTGQAA